MVRRSSAPSSHPTGPVTDARLREVEDLHKAVSALSDAARQGRNAVFRRAIAQRWTYERIAHATGPEHGTHRTTTASTPTEDDCRR
jgi:hypothetical protein